MKRYLTIDGGTTNTRLSLVEGGRVTKTLAYSVGAGTDTKDNTLLKRTVREGIKAILAECGLREEDLTAVIASGMLTSEMGLYALPHASAPVGRKELHDTMEAVTLPDVCSLPIFFIRGVKMVGACASDTDMMRGEETELQGLCGTENAVVVLPGTHSKIIETDGEGRIVRFATHMTGEMVAALSGHTILREAVSLKTVTAHRESLVEGCRYAMEQGLSAALFKVRVYKNLFGADETQTYGFFLGAILSAEVAAILRTEAPRVVLGGKRALREALALLLSTLGEKEIVCADEEAVAASSALGAVRIWEEN
ncbi:MAG: 2-dehydro-3-deoxygalactonokinase [Clostridia bacterium]|nr:2-dehydro-3-deoxygalactonokinase [Clostridia bacterium]